MKPHAERWIVAIGLGRLGLGLWLGFRPFDDTYITFRYALNLASGSGLVYNIGEPVLGTTSPLWAMILAALQIAGVPMEPGALVVSLGLDVASAVLLFRLLTGLEYRSEIAAGAAIFFLCFFDYFSLARSGMEISCFVFLTLATIETIIARRFVRAALCCALAVLVRPEGTLLVALLLLALWNARSSTERREVTVSLATLGVIVGGWAVFALWTFGSVVPQSVIAKAATANHPDLVSLSWTNLALFFLRGQAGGDLFERTYLQLMPAVTLLSGIAVMATVGDLVRNRSRVAAARAMALLLFPIGFVAGLALAHAFTYFPWYYGPVYPFAAALAVIGAGVVWRRHPKASVTICVVLVTAQLIAAVMVKLPNDRSFWVDGYLDVSRKVSAGPEIGVAAPEIGAVGWRVWPAKVHDLEGLVTPEAVGVPAHDYLRLKKPDYLVLRTDNGAELLRRLGSEGWFSSEYELIAERRDPYADREFRVYRIKPAIPNR